MLKDTLLVETSIGETRLALLEKGKLVECHLFRADDLAKVGARFAARVQSILADMNAAILDLGGETAIVPFRHARSQAQRSLPSRISECVHEGQRVVARIVRDAVPFDNKQAIARLEKAKGEVPEPQLLTPAPSSDDMIARHEKAGTAIISGTAGLFTDYGVDEKLELIIEGRVPLKSGGSLLIEEGRTLTSIDVNAAGADPLVTNFEAALALIDEIRLQKLGGNIVVDFIDIHDKGHRQKLLATLDSAMPGINRTGFSTFGLVELSLKREGPSLGMMLRSHTPPMANAQTLALDLMRLGEQVGMRAGGRKLHLTAPKRVLDWLQAHPVLLNTLSEHTSRAVDLKEAPQISAHL